MTITTGILDVLRFSFSWVKNKSYWKYYGIFAVLYFVINLFNAGSFAKLFDFNTVGIATAGVVIAVIFIAFLLLIYFGYELMYKTMQLKFSNLRPFNFSTFIGLIVTGIADIIYSTFSLFELKWLALLVLAIVFGVGAFLTMSNVVLAIVLGGIAVLCVLAYSVIFTRNFIRLSLASGFYLEGNGIRNSLSTCWDQTAGKALKLLLFGLVEVVVVIVISLVQLVPQLAASVGDAVVNLVGVPVNPFSALVSAVFSPLIAIFQTFFFVGMYNWLRNDSKQNNAVAPVAEKTVTVIAPVKPIKLAVKSVKTTSAKVSTTKSKKA